MTASDASILIAFVPLLLLRQDPRTLHADVHAYLLLLAAYAFTVFALKNAQIDPMDETLVLGVVAVASCVAFLVITQLVRTFGRGDIAAIIGQRFPRVATVSLAIGLAFLLVNVFFAEELASNLEIIEACAIAVTAIALAAHRAMTSSRSHAVHLGVLALVLLYAFFAYRTLVLDLLEGHHLQATLLIGAFLLWVGTRLDSSLKNPLCLDGILLASPAVLEALDTLSSRGAASLFLASLVSGYAGLKLSRRLFFPISLALLNLALFSLWQDHEILDPAFYGVPVGLSLLLGAELGKDLASSFMRQVLRISGFALVYGSIAVQVFRVEEPVHALVLFVLGLSAVIAGFAKQRADYQIIGSAAIVLDVIAYLARHGFERDFIGSALLVGAGLTLLAVAAVKAHARHKTRTTEVARDRPES